MEKDPDKRFADAYVVNRRLQELLRKVELSSDRCDARQRLAPVRTRRRSTWPRAKERVPAGNERRSGSRHARCTICFAPRSMPRIDRRGSKSCFENTWLLVGALVVVVAGVAYWTHVRTLTPEQRFDKGVALLEENEEGKLANRTRRLFRSADCAAIGRLG